MILHKSKCKKIQNYKSVKQFKAKDFAVTWFLDFELL